MDETIMKADGKDLAWPGERLGEALRALASINGYPIARPDTSNPPEGQTQRAEPPGQWIEACARWMGFEAEPAEISYSELESALRTAAPSLLRIPGGGQPEFLAVVGARRGRITILGPDFAQRRTPLERVHALLRRPIDAPYQREIEDLLKEAGVPKRRLPRSRDAILQERLGHVASIDCWFLRLPPGASLWQQVRHERLLRYLAGLAGAHLLEYLLWLAGWWLVGQGVLQGRLDRGWLFGWALLLLTTVPLRQCATWWQGRVAIAAGRILKLRLLAGALRLQTDEIRHQGSGQLLGRVIESQTVESLALSGGFLVLTASIELIVTAAVLAQGAGGVVHALLLPFWVALTVFLIWRYYRDQQNWTDTRLDMTHDLVERMAGHRTRLVQEGRTRWHEEEDNALSRYLGISQRLDRSASWLVALVPRGWLAIGLLGLGFPFVTGATSHTALAVALGGTLLGFQALQKLTTGMWNLVGAGVAWKQVAPLFHAAARPEVHGPPILSGWQEAPRDEANDVVLEAHHLQFRYHGRGGDPVLRDCSFAICSGDRLLVEGPSGGGKSTLASLIAGLRLPESGLLLARGLDRQTLGSDGWRRHVAITPQFHENHVLVGTLAFNALLGRQGLLRADDYAEAETICRELGLDELLQRMPGGMLQQVGETGWQLSHGERSRLYIARALLQGADLVVLDESFAALDPENLARAFQCVARRTDALLVIAHS